MRLWSLHPHYLDTKGLVALWREGLLAKAVILGQTKGYTKHPQLHRFYEHPCPQEAINTYLDAVLTEAQGRGYRFDATKLHPPKPGHLLVTHAQLTYEFSHLLKKLNQRDPVLFQKFHAIQDPLPHPLFQVIHGPIADWEKT